MKTSADLPTFRLPQPDPGIKTDSSPLPRNRRRGNLFVTVRIKQHR
jgi:hypothetical protein